MRRVINPKGVLLFMGIIETIMFLVVVFLILPQTDTDADAWKAIGVYIAVMIFSGVVVVLALKPLLREQAITEKGQPARGKLLNFWDTGTTINDHPLVGMQLEVQPPGRPAYQAETKTVIPRLSVGMLQPGAAVQVMFDPKDPQRVSFVDFEPVSPQDTPEPEPEERSMAYGEYLQGRVAELEELHKRRMVTDDDYQRRREELGRLARVTGGAAEATSR